MDSTSPPIVFRRNLLAARLGVSRDRLHFEILVQDGSTVAFEILIDGKDLTPEQERIAVRFIEEHKEILSACAMPTA